MDFLLKKALSGVGMDWHSYWVWGLIAWATSTRSRNLTLHSKRPLQVVLHSTTEQSIGIIFLSLTVLFNGPVLAAITKTISLFFSPHCAKELRQKGERRGHFGNGLFCNFSSFSARHTSHLTEAPLFRRAQHSSYRADAPKALISCMGAYPFM